MFAKVAEFILFGIGPLVACGLFFPAAIAAGERFIAGEAFYRERIALPKNATFTVEIADVSNGEDAVVLASRTIEPAGQMPIRFEVGFDQSKVTPGGRYAVQARIAVNGDVWFATQARHALDPFMGGDNRITLNLARAVGNDQRSV